MLRGSALHASGIDPPCAPLITRARSSGTVRAHARYLAFQMAEVAVPRTLFAEILRMIAELRPPPIKSTAEGVRLSRA